jgi:hypothetical protein
MGGGPGGDMLPPDGGMMMNSSGSDLGMTPGQNTTGETQQSLIQELSSKSSANVDLNVFFANAVINLLEQQVNA